MAVRVDGPRREKAGRARYGLADGGRAFAGADFRGERFEREGGATVFVRADLGSGFGATSAGVFVGFAGVGRGSPPGRVSGDLMPAPTGGRAPWTDLLLGDETLVGVVVFRALEVAFAFLRLRT